MSPTDSPQVRISQWQRQAMLAGFAGILLCVVGLILDRDQFFRSYLFGYIYWTAMGIGCLGILLLNHVVGGKWGLPLRRFVEAGSRTVPYMAVLFIPVVLGMKILYPWARPEAIHDANIVSKSGYLNPAFFTIRAIFYFAIFFLYSRLLTKYSDEQDRTGDDRLIGKMRALSAPGLVVATLVATFAFIDWVMSLEPHWFSTIYGAMFLMGAVVEAFALTIALLIILVRFEPLREYVKEQHIHDLGNLMFAFMILWAYTSFSQYLIIWAGNLPEEVPWYVNRLTGGWGWVALTIVAFHFATPFVLLLMRGIKRRADRLLKVCILLVIIRMLDVYWLTEPAFFGRHLHFSWMDLAALLAVGGIWLSLYFRELNTRPLVPLRDPRLAGAPRETVAF